MFRYKMSARRQAFKTLILSLGFVVITGIFPAFLVYNMVYNHEFSLATVVGAVLFGFIMLVGLFLILGSIFRFITGGVWDIEITNSEVIWRAPVFAEHSFQVNIDNIAFIEKSKKRKIKSNGEKIEKVFYYFELKDGERLLLFTQSGINIEEFILSLTSYGVEAIEKETT